MTREIKFRGKTKKGKKWVYGYYYSECDNFYIIEDRQKESLLNKNQPYKVDESTIGQFTGLKDKNGRDIYEGDILAFNEEENVIIYNEVGIKNGCFGYIAENDGALLPFCNYCVEETIVGNIYDNKELLNQE